MQTIFKHFVVALIAGLLCTAITAADSSLVRAQGQQQPRSGSTRYACPMHPDVTSTKQGRCPRCGMKLRLVTDQKEQTGATPPVQPADTESPDLSAFSSARIPDARVLDQNGNRLNFYSDLVKGRTVAINFIFTTCTTICPPLTATFRRVQQELGQRGLAVQLISISVDPTTDTPERMRDFASKFKAGPGWTFVTGDKGEIDSLLKAMGTAVADKNDHTPMILIGNDVKGYWTRSYGLASPTELVKVIEAAVHK